MKTQTHPFGFNQSGAWRLWSCVLALALQACGGGGDAPPNVSQPIESAAAPTPVVAGPAKVAEGPGTVVASPAPVAATPVPVAAAPLPVAAAPVPVAPAPVAAAPSSGLVALDASTSCSIPGFRQALMDQVNAARGAGRTCGGQALPAAAAVAWNDLLFSAAARHSLDMASRNYFGHQSPDGTQASQRVSAEGYGWSAVGENIAAGNTSVSAVMASWLGSEGHCRNIMQPVVRDMGVACVRREGTSWGTYWTMVLASH